VVRGLLVRGMLAGLLAGLVAFAFARILGEPQIERAIAFEQHGAAAAAEPQLVSRAVQSTVGLFAGIGVFGCGLGGLFAIAFACAHGRVGGQRPRATAAGLAAIGFVALVLVPQIKYPASPPAVGDPGTIGLRTALYVLLAAFSLIAAVAAVSTARQLAVRLGGWNGALAAAAAYLAVVVAAMLILPAVDEVPPGFPASTLWHFRLAALGVQTVLWATLGLAFGAFAERFLPAPGIGRAPWREREPGSLR
jgi:hypothetical protein